MDFTKVVSLNLSAGGTVGGDLTVSGDLTVDGNSSGNYDEIINGHLDLADNNILNVGDISLDTISSDAGTSINVVLGSDSGDDFLVDTDKLVVEGDTGNVGIGTASPDRALVVAKTSDNTGNGTGGALKVCLGDDLTKTVNIGYDSSDYGFIEAVDEGVVFKNLVLCPTAGNVGIGTTSPDTLLHISAGSAGSVSAHSDTRLVVEDDDNCTIATLSPNANWNGFQMGSVTDSTGAILQWNYDARQLYLGTTPAADGGFITFHTGVGTERMRITSEGRLGINTTAPDRPLHVSAGSAGTVTAHSDTLVVIEDNETTGMSILAPTDAIGVVRFGTDGDATRGAIKYYHSAYSTAALRDSLEFATGNDTARMMINSGGNVGIGDTSPDYRLDVEGDDAGAYIGHFTNAGNDANRYGIGIQAGANDGSGTTYYVSAFDGDGNSVGWTANTSGTFALTDVSDKRLKENIRDTEIKGLDAVSSMKVRDFEWKKSGDTCIGGFVAQELGSAFAPAVTGEDGALEEDGRIKPMGVSRDRLVPVLVKAIQELTSKVEALENA